MKNRILLLETQVQPIAFRVRNTKKTYVVEHDADGGWSCSCRHAQRSPFPCTHALAVLYNTRILVNDAKAATNAKRPRIGQK